MNKLFVAVLFTISLATAVMAQDPVKVDSKHYTVEFENAQVRVLRIKYGPHEKSVMHRHPNAVAVFMTDGSTTFTFPKGAPQQNSNKAGETLWTPAGLHLPENTGDQPFEVILVELKSPVKKAAKKPATAPATPKQ
jgi:quercetin dioxygenase-like cupin family protein